MNNPNYEHNTLVFHINEDSRLYVSEWTHDGEQFKASVSVEHNIQGVWAWDMNMTTETRPMSKEDVGYAVVEIGADFVEDILGHFPPRFFRDNIIGQGTNLPDEQSPMDGK